MDELPNLKELSNESKEALIKSLWQKVQDLQKQIEIGKTPKKAKNSSIPPSKGRKQSSTSSLDQLYQELGSHSDTFYVQPFYTDWLKNASPELTSAQLDKAICHARSAILGLSIDFVSDTVDRLFADSNPLNLESNTPDDHLVPSNKNIKRMREQMQLDPAIFYVIVLETNSLFDEMIRHGYSNTPANRNKVLQEIAPTVTQLFIRCLDACSRALAEV